ncbi:hypothetical protein BYT27DRAFT_6558409 [Phlegmacium glaucopus]|nr:hypothetical protein BYT27DRAFT_6558409 [Phlegmacium glaucopus]
MQANVRIKAKEDVDKQKEKERKREEKELRKIAAANGIKMAKMPSSTLATVPVPDSGSLATVPGMGMDMSMDVDGGKPAAEPKTGGGWASLSTSQGFVHSHVGFKKSGWATVGPSSSSNPLSSSQSISAIDRQPPSGHAATSSSSITSHDPTFRNAGWSSLDTAGSQPIPVTSTTSSSSHGGPGWPKGPTSSKDESGSGERWQGSTEPADPTPLPPPEPVALQSLTSMPPVPPIISKPPRSNWQQFQKGASRRK